MWKAFRECTQTLAKICDPFPVDFLLPVVEDNGAVTRSDLQGPGIPHKDLHDRQRGVFVEYGRQRPVSC